MSHAGTLPKSSVEEGDITRQLVQVLLHVFSPMLSSLAEAVRTATPIAVTLHTSKRKDGGGSPPAPPCTTTSSQATKPGSGFLPLSPPGTGERSTPSSAASPRSPLLDRTAVFSSPEGPAEAREGEQATSSSVYTTVSPSSSPLPLSNSMPGGRARGRPRLVLTAASLPPPLVTAPITQTNEEPQSAAQTAAGDETHTNCSVACCTISNAVLWEAVAAFAESMLMDGAVFSWLCDTAEACEDCLHDCDEEKRRGSALLVPRRKQRIEPGRSRRDTPAWHTGRCHYSTAGHATPAHLLAHVLLHFDHYAADELQRFGFATGGADALGSPSVSQNFLLGEACDTAAPDVVFCVFAAAVVRSVALHTAHLLRPLAALEVHTMAIAATAERDSGDTRGHKIISSSNSNSTAPLLPHVDTDDEGVSSPYACERTFASSASCPFAHYSLDTAPATTFRAVQEELKAHHRQLQQARQLWTAASPAGRRTSTLQKKAEAAASTTTASGALESSQLTACVKEAEAKDASVFLLARHRPRSPSSRATTLTTAGATRNKMYISNVMECAAKDVALVRGAGTSVLADTPKCTVFAVSCVLPEVFHREGVLTSSPAAHDSTTALYTAVSGSASAGVRDDVTARDADDGLLRSSSSSSFLEQWCDGVQQLASTMLSADVPHSSAASPPHAAQSVYREITAASARVYRRLSDLAVNSQAEHVTWYAGDRDRPTPSPSSSTAQSPAIDATLNPRKEGDGETDFSVEDGVNSTGHTTPWSTAQWSIRPPFGVGDNLGPLHAPVEGLDDHHTSADESPSSFAPGPSHRRGGGATSGVKRGRRAILSPTATKTKGLPRVAWVRLPSSAQEVESHSLAEPAVQTSTAALFHHLIPLPAEYTASARSATTDTSDVLGEVGAVLACVDAVCASRTVLDTSSWRYGRNRINIAAASFISLNDVAEKPQSSSLAGVPCPSSQDGGASTAARSSASEVALPAGLERSSSTVGLYHHESGVLYVSDGATYAMEVE
jgi:hypothetical protein